MLIQPPTAQADTVLAALEASQADLMRWIVDAQVTNQDEEHRAEDLLISARFARKQADDKRRELTRPLDDAKARIIGLFQPYINRLDTAINFLSVRLTDYHLQLVNLRHQEETRVLEEQAAKMREAQETGELVDLPPQPDVAPVPRTSHANLGAVTYREDVDIRIIQPAKVPRDLCEPSMSKIRARVKSGVTDIPGVLVTKKLVTVTRR